MYNIHCISYMAWATALILCKIRYLIIHRVSPKSCIQTFTVKGYKSCQLIISRERDEQVVARPGKRVILKKQLLWDNLYDIHKKYIHIYTYSL